MSQQAVGGTYDKDSRTLTEISEGKSAPSSPLGELVVGVRIDTLPQAEADRLAADGKFHPLTIDKDGFLRVTMPDGIKVETEELSVLREIRDRLTAGLDLLQQIASNG